MHTRRRADRFDPPGKLRHASAMRVLTSQGLSVPAAAKQLGTSVAIARAALAVAEQMAAAGVDDWYELVRSADELPARWTGRRRLARKKRLAGTPQEELSAA